MHEVEVKLQFKDANYNDVKDSIKKLNPRWSGKITQKDEIYLSKDMQDYKIIPGTKIVRIREERKESTDSVYILTMKIQQLEKLSSLEYESIISNPESVDKMIKEWGFKKFVTVEKKRQKAKVEGYNFCLDEVKDLGVFLEIEFLSSELVDSKKVQGAIKEFIKRYKLPPYEFATTPYDTQIFLKKNGNKKYYRR